ncbi:MAG: Bro-N domain-containing protein [Clostridiales bacterium]|nr:Bro-N domain-containing protein [Clostridiales bacterium]
MSELQLIKSAKFGEVQADIYQRNNEPYMTTEQLGECLGYSHPKQAISKILERNDYLKNSDFSGVVKMGTPDGGTQNTRVFTEDGIYEITMLAKTDKAREFRTWIRGILKSLRKGETKLVGMTQYQTMIANTRSENAKIRKAQILTRLAEQYNGTYRQVLNSYATKELTGEHLLPLPELPRKTYTAAEIGDKLGISANKVGVLTNRHDLKTEQYGAWFCDKAKSCNKEVQSFRYFDNVIDALRRFI